MKIPGLIFLSGQTPVGADGTVVPGDVGAHTVRSVFLLSAASSIIQYPHWLVRLLGHQTQCVKNLTAVLAAAGSSWDKVVKVNVYLKDMGDFAAMNEVYEKVFR